MEHKERFDWDDLKLLLALSETGTVTRAAEQLHLNPTTLPRRVRRLEERIGKKLIERVKGGVVLTADANQLVLIARQTHEGLQRALDPQIALDPIAGLVRLSGTDFMLDLMTDTIAHLCRKHRGLVIDLKPTNDFLNLAQRETDVAIRIADSPSDGLIGRRLGPMTLGLYGPPGCTEPFDRWIGWHLPRGSAVIDNAIRDHNPTGKVVARVDSFMMQVQLVMAGVGVAVLPDKWVAHRSEFLTLARIEDIGEEQAWVVTHEELRRVPRVQAVMSAIAQSYSSDA